ncbi:MAG TPA: RdgB/HAM1 family non-canonical purine NTP pyrophosphatase [Woeseiaceae bacterium]|nr:RdgB/HAM1 family non-canonical purine NTP pyrophosphatase [Woeseiaceae bacterium]
MKERTVVIASGNRGKLAEIRRLMAPLELDVRPQSDYSVTPAAETGETFTENALLKARHASAIAGLPAIGDDSGLEVAALGGGPGVRSSRFAGETATDEENIDKLLEALRNLPLKERSANFRCVAVYVESPDDPQPLVAAGVWDGRIIDRRRGAGGFGYDPVFLDPVSNKTAAEMTGDEKNAASHRGQAFRALSALIADALKTRGEVRT